MSEQTKRTNAEWVEIWSDMGGDTVESACVNIMDDCDRLNEKVAELESRAAKAEGERDAALAQVERLKNRPSVREVARQFSEGPTPESRP